MSYNPADDVPPLRKPSSSRIRGRMSTAYESVTPVLTIQEPTPKLQQDQFDAPSSDNDDLYRDPSPTPGPSRSPKEHSRTQSSPVIPGSFQQSRPVTPENNESQTSDTTPRQSVSRRTSIPIRGILSRPTTPTIMVEVHCSHCTSIHKVNVSNSNRATVLDCNTNPKPTPTPPSVLEMYSLPGYLKLNESGQILVKTEPELLSYVRKIFSPSDGFKGYFPSSRNFTLDKDDELPEDTSVSSTPDSARASYYFGHSHYRGTALQESEPTTKESSKDNTHAQTSPNISPLPAPSGPSQTATPSSPPPPPIHKDSKPSSRDTSRQRSISPLALVRTTVPTTPRTRSPSSPQYASAARHSSPRNLHSIGVFSESEVDLSKQLSPSDEKETVSTYMPRTAVQPPPAYQTRTILPVEIYSAADEVSKELEAEQRINTLFSSSYATPRSSSKHRGRELGRR